MEAIKSKSSDDVGEDDAGSSRGEDDKVAVTCNVLGVTGASLHLVFRSAEQSSSIPYAQMAHWKQTEQLFQPDVNVPSGQGAHDS